MIINFTAKKENIFIHLPEARSPQTTHDSTGKQKECILSLPIMSSIFIVLL